MDGRRHGVQTLGVSAIIGAGALVLSAASGAVEAHPASLQPSLPEGVPDGAEEATVADYNDGDKLVVEIDGIDQEILLAGIDAPEPGECYRAESKARVEELLPLDTVVYLERSGTNLDGKKRPIRYLWIPGGDGAKAFLLNTKLVREGFAGFDDRKDNPKYFDRLRELQAEAKKKKVGLWGACGGVHEPPRPKATNTPVPTPIPPTPTPEPAAAPITDCSPFASFEDANAYYAGHPEAQPYLDPNFDGRACEVYFGVDQAGISYSGGSSGGGGYTASDYDCADFSTHAEAQAAWEANGGSAFNNLWNLDADHDGVACESLP